MGLEFQTFGILAASGSTLPGMFMYGAGRANVRITTQSVFCDDK